MFCTFWVYLKAEAAVSPLRKHCPSPVDSASRVAESERSHLASVKGDGTKAHQDPPGPGCGPLNALRLQAEAQLVQNTFCQNKTLSDSGGEMAVMSQKGLF